MKKLISILETISNTGYFEVFTINNTINNIKALPFGINLQNKLKEEWYSTESGMKTYQTKNVSGTQNQFVDLNCQHNYPLNLLKNPYVKEILLKVRNSIQQEVPFAIKSENHFAFTKTESNNTEFKIDLPSGTLLTCSYFLSAHLSIEYFYKIQRERKIWWMKYASNPGRYTFFDLKSDVVNNQSVQSVYINSKYSFGNMNIEKIQLVPLKATKVENLDEFMMFDPRLHKKALPVVVQTEFCLESAALGLLMDAIENSKEGKIGIHRKIAPYQCSILCYSEKLVDLAKHLYNEVQNAGISTLKFDICNNGTGDTLDKVLLEIDKIGVPYSLILEEDTLKTGLLNLRNRDTSLSEVIHISDVPEYILKILHS